MIKLKRFKMGQPIGFMWCAAIITEVRIRRGELLDLISDPTPGLDAYYLNTLLTWLVENYPDEFEWDK